MAHLIVLSGLAGSGKSTIAAELERSGYTIVKFSAPLKDMMRAVGLSDREIEGDLKELPSHLLCGKSPRYAMQMLGTEWGRQLIGEDFWVSAWQQSVRAVLEQGGKVVTDDCRYGNELDAALDLGGTPIRLIRRGAGIAGSHSSETGLEGVGMPTVHNDRPPKEVARDILYIVSEATCS